MNLQKKYKRSYGLTHVVSKNKSGLKIIEFDILKLQKGEIYENNTKINEAAFIILYGSCNVNGNNFDFPHIGVRGDVFSGKPASFYLPNNTSYKIEALNGIEIAVCSAQSAIESKPTLINPEDIIEKSLGVLGWERKAHFIIDNKVNSENLFIGETLLSPGKWAFPPHRHDNDNLPEEVEMEEIYHYRVSPREGFGIQVVYTDDRKTDEAYLVRNGDTILLPTGYHPAAASPVDSIYILWVMAGKKRYFLSRPDDNYNWVPKIENLLK